MSYPTTTYPSPRSSGSYIGMATTRPAASGTQRILTPPLARKVEQTRHTARRTAHPYDRNASAPQRRNCMHSNAGHSKRDLDSQSDSEEDDQEERMWKQLGQAFPESEERKQSRQQADELLADLAAMERAIFRGRSSQYLKSINDEKDPDKKLEKQMRFHTYVTNARATDERVRAMGMGPFIDIECSNLSAGRG